ncbi:hypothetical protein RDV89_10890 [Nocardioides zeae]|uniref:Uncharacterized protein n=1 Tax=Nocardioides imazamoxiresistens TaxID=3231893 RepID=A0ABU3PWG1_9ACTN|nr:hypothetical protein [Nocardioides zeae]MDT9593575.1 hypothetical protein [Nocardioides zeae]
MTTRGKSESELRDHRTAGAVLLLVSGVLVVAGYVTEGWETAIVVGALLSLPAWWFLLVAAVGRGVAIGLGLAAESARPAADGTADPSTP